MGFGVVPTQSQPGRFLNFVHAANFKVVSWTSAVQVTGFEKNINHRDSEAQRKRSVRKNISIVISDPFHF